MQRPAGPVDGNYAELELMAVYVDSIRRVKPNGRWRSDHACHLFADSLEELMSFAGRLGLGPGWIHQVPGFPHYDLTIYKRRDAIKLGAKPVLAEFTAGWRKRRKEHGEGS